MSMSSEEIHQILDERRAENDLADAILDAIACATLGYDIGPNSEPKKRIADAIHKLLKTYTRDREKP